MDDTSMITYIGRVDHRNKLTRFGIRAKDRTKHMYVIGKTGTGKSTFLENMLVQDIQNGHGVAFIDPHGGSAEKLLNYIPEWRINDVIYFDVSDTDFPIAFNPLEDLGPMKRPLIADGLMSVFKKIWPDAFSGRMEYILNNTMLALLEYPDPTILGINRMLTDKEFRKKVVANVSDPIVKNAWDELMKWDDKRWSEASGALINKVGQFSTNPLIRNIIGQSQSTFDFRKAMDERKIIIINLSKGKIGEQNAPLLGAMLITKIYLAAMSRAELAAHVIEKMPPFYFYVDEFQNFANDSFANILSEARKYKLCLTVANQYIAQMEETIRDAVFGNMGTTVSFRVGPLDAEFMEKVLAPIFTADDLQNIAFGQYYVSLQIDGMGSKPFSAQGLPPIPPLQNSLRELVINASRSQFARPRDVVESMLADWFGFNKQETKVVRTNIGSTDRPEGVVPPRDIPPTRNAQTRPPAPGSRPQTPSPEPQKKTLPPLQGFRNKSDKKPSSDTAQTTRFVPVKKSLPNTPQTEIQKKSPIIPSTQITDQKIPQEKNNPETSRTSLDQSLQGLDDMIITAPSTPSLPVSPQDQKPLPLTQEIKRSSEEQPSLSSQEPLQGASSVQQSNKVQVPEKLSRSAQAGTKSALADVLARALQEKGSAPITMDMPRDEGGVSVVQEKVQEKVFEQDPLVSQADSNVSSDDIYIPPFKKEFLPSQEVSLPEETHSHETLETDRSEDLSLPESELFIPTLQPELSHEAPSSHSSEVVKVAKEPEPEPDTFTVPVPPPRVSAQGTPREVPEDILRSILN